MKHTKNYMDAMWVIENPERYDDRDVVRANGFIEAYNEGYNQALSLGAVVVLSDPMRFVEEPMTGREKRRLRRKDLKRSNTTLKGFTPNAALRKQRASEGI